MAQKSSKENSSSKKKNNVNGIQNKCGHSAGSKCPHCGKGILDYNGMLNLECPHCKFEYGYGFT